MALNTWAGVTDFPIAPRSTPPPLTFGPFSPGAAQAGKKMQVVMLIDPADAADPTKGGKVELMVSDDGGTTWRASDQGSASWTGGDPNLITDRAGNTWDPPRVGFTFDLGLVADPKALVNKTLGIRGTLTGSPVRVGLGHKVG